LHAVLPPLFAATGDSTIVVRGGTHVAWSPPFDYLRDVLLPTLATLGMKATAELVAPGWYPAGEGEVRATVAGLGPDWRRRVRPLKAEKRGSLRSITGRSIAANLPSHIPQRMADRARALLGQLTDDVRIEPLRVNAACPGAGIFLTAHYDNVICGFNALGERGKRAETVAEEAVGALLAHHRSGAALDVHLGDQVLPFLAFAGGVSRYTTERVSRHLVTNAWVIEHFGIAEVTVAERDDGTGVVTVAAHEGNDA
jgi:RNA 3'-terminal phosphate cyclase (ATP)